MDCKDFRGNPKRGTEADIDIIECAEQYVYLFYGQALYDSLLSGLDVERLRRGMYNSYKLMKTKETPKSHESFDKPVLNMR